MFASLIILLAAHLLAANAHGQACECSSVVLPVDVNTLIAKDPTDPFGGLRSNATALRRLNAEYDIFGVFCTPNEKTAQSTDVIQLLVHGLTYNNEYWSPKTEEFQNQSYTAYACDRGLSTLAIDLVGVGKSTRPTNASDAQYITNAAAMSQLARHLKNASILPGIKPFNQVIGVGHSSGSVVLIAGAITEAERSPFDGLVLTSQLSFQPGQLGTPPGEVSARDDTPLRWGSLDPNYVTSDIRFPFYPADTTLFSPRMLVYDNFTKDVAPVSFIPGISISSLPANYTGPVAKLAGLRDQAICVGTGRCNDLAALTALERVLWPKAKSFEVVLTEGGHCMTLDFLADGAFSVFVKLVKEFAGLHSD
ncbi:hypothetical protein FB45DRAFT_1063823 [Roridomyces roridus]|uniref:AB hydrolase-1 domain-containing protein n=1 Tax=Roridomyces roridus TaxID=1738132 RepID=A0AAD7BDF0_9AGAR|nr:hypothetical protein FB45DRAFT_1063823 [Roridomyces roridus]